MTAGARASLTARLVTVLSGSAALDQDVAPPLLWSAHGSFAAAALRAATAAVGAALRPLIDLFDAAADRLARWGVAVACAAACALLLPLLTWPVPSPIASALLGLAGLAVAMRMARGLHEDRCARWVLRALVAGFALRLLLAVALEWRGGFPDEYGVYHPLAADTAACWSAGGPSLLPTHPIVQHRAAYFYLLSGIYYVSGPSMLVGRVLGGCVGLFGAVLAGEVARPLAGRRAAALAVVLLALHPEHAFWGVTLSRDALSTLLLLTALALILRRRGRLLRGNLLLVAVPLVLLAWNSLLVTGALGALLIALCVAEALGAARPSVSGVLLPAAAAVLVLAGLTFVGYRYGAFVSIEYLDAIRHGYAGGGADFLPDFRVEGVLDVAALLGAGSLFVLAAPFPWDAVHVHRAAYAPLAAVGLAIAVLGVVGLSAAVRRRPAAAAPVVIAAVALLCVLALLEYNSGIVVRHRLPLTALLTVGAAVLLAGRRGR